jgi:hypothetical protein
MTQDSANPRPALVTIVMLGVLLLTVGAAWVVVRYYYSPSRVGATVIAEIRRRTLGELWPKQKYAAWFDRKDALGKIESRRGVVRQSSNGAFAGEMLHLAVSGASRRIGNVRADWTMSDNLTKGYYRASYLGLGLAVEIDLDGQQVHLRGTQMGTESVDVPANYIPEGLEWLAIRLAAQGGKKATFMLISDIASLQNKTIAFDRVVVTPLDAQSARCRYETGGPPVTWTYHFDAAGEVVHGECDDGSVLIPAPGPVEGPATEGPESDGSAEEEPAGDTPVPSGAEVPAANEVEL